MPTLIDQARRDYCTHLVEAQDKIIREAITKFLGHSDWEIKDLLGRGEWTPIQGKREQFYLDGELLVEFYPLFFEHNVDNEDFSHTISTNINYKVFV